MHAKHIDPVHLAATIAALCLTACVSFTQPSETSPVEVSQRLAHYASLLQLQDSPAMAATFSTSGFMAHEGQPAIVGRPAIQAFLESFARYKVLSHQMQITSSVTLGQSVQQAGTFTQSVLTPDGEKLEVGGTFIAVWRQEPDGQWLIQSMRTAPAGKR